jgi:DNA repair photolyase
MIKRVFLNFSNKKMCENGCLYCFADWPLDDSNYDLLRNEGNDVIIYPLCNDDLTPSDDIAKTEKYLERCLSLQSGFSRISISTKTNVSPQFLEWIAVANRRFANKGLIKLSVSFSCRGAIPEIEPKAASYNDRLSLLKNIKNQGIPTSVILKPVLPFVETAEYVDIINDASPYTDAVVLGGLYVNQDTPFYHDYIAAKYNLEKRSVLWLKNKPLWLVVESAEKIEQIKDCCAKKGIRCYMSDAEHLATLSGKRLA